MNNFNIADVSRRGSLRAGFTLAGGSLLGEERVMAQSDERPGGQRDRSEHDLSPFKSKP